MFGSHENRGANKKIKLFLHANILICFSSFRLDGLEWSIAHLSDLLRLSCLSGWKLFSIYVFGMKHVWDIHLLLLLLLHLLGAATSQVNPGPCWRQRANSIAQSSVLWFKCLQTQTAVRSCWRVCESYKMTEFLLVFSGSVLQSRLPLVQMLDKCSFVGAMWSPSLCFGLFDPSMKAFPQLSRHCMGGLWERQPIFVFYFYNGNIWWAETLSNRNQKEVSSYCWNCRNAHQIFPSKNSNLATVFDFSLKLLSSSSVSFIVDRIMNDVF